MNPILTVGELYDAQQTPLKLRWLAGRDGGDRPLEAATAKYPGMALVGHLNFVHPNRVQVLGSGEVEYLRSLPEAEQHQAVARLFGCATTTLVVIANDETADPALLRAADQARMPLLASPLGSPRLIDSLQHYLTRTLAARTSVHGVYLEVLGLGVLITGESGLGKSELALELLSRGHHLIADDSVELSRTGPNVLLGRSPGMLRDFLEVRGLGILNVRAMFGDTAVRPEKTLRLIVHLEPLTPERMKQIDRLQIEQKTRTILDVDIPEVVLYVAPGRNLAVLVEAATRHHILRLRGISPLDELIQRQEHSMELHAAPAERGRKA
jgi:HPr kinase/phosphorylase